VCEGAHVGVCQSAQSQVEQQQQRWWAARLEPASSKGARELANKTKQQLFAVVG